jgi:hypothetical protein
VGVELTYPKPSEYVPVMLKEGSKQADRQTREVKERKKA